MAIDSLQEIYTGVGLGFPVCPLNQTQMQLEKTVADQLGVTVGQNVSVHWTYIDDEETMAQPNSINSQQILTLFEYLTLDMDFMLVDHENNSLVFEEGVVLPIEELF